MAEKLKIYFRLEFNSNIGTGHLMRCITLASELKKRGVECHFVISKQSKPQLYKQINDFSIHTLSTECYSAADAEETRKMAKKSFLVIDGYDFKEEYLENISKEESIYLIMFDDFNHLSHYNVSLLINNNSYASSINYAFSKNNTNSLLGCKYVLLREEFIIANNSVKEIKPLAENILITLGGGNAYNLYSFLLCALNEFSTHKLNLRIIVGANCKNLKHLKGLAEESIHNVEVFENVSQMSDYMQWADIAVTAGGTTNWELCYMGVPSLMIILAENQLRTANDLQSMNITESLGWHYDLNKDIFIDNLKKLIISIEQRSQMNIEGRKLVDGQGVHRVADYLISKMGVS